MKITLYGNIVTDNIYFTDGGIVASDFIIREGGIKNVERAIRALNKDIEIELSHPLAKDEAAIIIDKTNSTKQSVINLKNSTHRWQLPANNSDWHHIAYLDLLPYLGTSNLDHLSGGIISADVATPNRRILSFAPYIDFLFIAEEDADELKINRNIAQIATIIHSANGSKTFFRDGVFQKFVDAKQGINVLGAGDAFAASFILNKLFGKNLHDSVEQAHKNATELISNGY